MTFIGARRALIGKAPLLRPKVAYTGGSKSRLGQGVGYYNFHLMHSRRLRAKLHESGRRRWLMVGDSTTENPATAQGGLASAPPKKLATYLNGNGITADAETHFGQHGEANIAAFLAVDPRFTGVTGWVTASTESVGGQLTANTTTTNIHRFLPGSTFDTLGWWYPDFNTGSPQFTIDIGGSVLDTVNVTGGTNALLRRQLTLGPGATFANWKRVSGNVYIAGIECFTAGARTLSIFNAGRKGWRSVDWAVGTNPYSPRSAIVTLGFDIVSVCLGINDWRSNSPGPTSVSGYKGQMELIIQAILGYGGIPILIVPNPSDPAFPTQTQSDYIDALYELSDLYQVPLFDISAKWTDYATANAAGWMDDQIHPNSTGYQQIANFLGAGVLMVAA